MDLSNEHACWDGTEAVYLQISRGASLAERDRYSSMEYVPVAKRRALAVRDLAVSAGVYTGSDLFWHLPVSVLTSGITPKLGDVVIDSDQVRWTVWEASLERRRQRWKLTCRNLTLAYDLRDTIDVQRATIARDAAGAALKLFPPAGGQVLYPALPCRVQLVSQDVAEERGVRGRQSLYTVIVDRQIDLDTEDRLVWQGRILDVLSYRNPEQTTELPVIDAVEKP